MSEVDFTIIEVGEEWADRYCDFCQPIYQEAYAAPKLGIPAEVFSKAEFDDPSTRKYFKNIFTENHVWLALDKNENILGGIAASDTDPVHLGGFYVETKLQGKGIGRKLFKKLLDFANERDIVLDVMKHRKKSIAMYERWGFVIDESTPPRLYNWPYPTERGKLNGAGITMRRRNRIAGD